MVFRWLADLVVLLHLAFVLFAVFGALLVLRWGRLAWLHLPAAAWAALIELAGWVCPLTPLENRLRLRAGGARYEGGFVEHYVLPVLYPAELTRSFQVQLGILVIAINAGIYIWVLLKHRGGARPST